MVPWWRWKQGLCEGLRRRLWERKVIGHGSGSNEEYSVSERREAHRSWRNQKAMLYKAAGSVMVAGTA